MREIEVVVVNPLWNEPWVLTILSSMLTGLFFALVIFYYSRHMERRDTITSLNTELTGNYRSLKLIQDNTDVKGLEENPDIINALKREMPWNNKLTEKELLLDFLKNQAVDQQISVECWNRLQSQIAKYPDKYTIYEELYTILERLLRFSKILTGEINTNNPVDKAVFKQFSVIRKNSEEFIKKFEKHFL